MITKEQIKEIIYKIESDQKSRYASFTPGYIEGLDYAKELLEDLIKDENKTKQ